jgi:hypothetical protein
VTIRHGGHRLSDPFQRFVVSVERRVISVASRVTSVDPRGNWG